MTNQMENQQRKHRTFTRYVFLFFILTGLSALVAYAASFLVKKEWRAEAYVGAPTINVLGNYYSLSSMYELVSGKKNELSPTELAYREFKKQAMSHDVITQFWKNTDFYRQKQTGESMFDQQELERLSKSFGFSTEQVLNSVNGSMGDRISLTLGSPKQATELLGDFVDYVNLQTRNVVYNELIYRWKVLFDEVKKAGEFNLGNLQKNNGIVSAEDWQGKLKLMQSVNPLDDQFVAYRYFKKPTTSVNYTSPNRVLWAVIGAGIGLLMSLLIISVFSRLRKNA